jgi:hypothetical protein
MLYVDMLGNKSMVPFSLVLDVPGYESARADARAQGAAIVPVNHENLDSLRTALEELPNCTTAAGSPDCTGPLNLIMIGAINDLASAVNRRGYRRNELDADQSQHVFGRPAELIARKRAQAGSAATWIRAWRAPVDYRGTPVFVVQVARPMGGRFANGNTRNLKLHGDVDEARNLFIQDMMYSGGLDAIGFLPSVDAVPRSSPRKLADGSRYFTDGIRAVLLISVRPLTFADVEYLDWEPFVERVEAEASR